MKIVVVGTGYVGLVAGVCFAEVGYDVTCIDIDENKIKLMRQGISPIYEKDLEELMKKNNEIGRLHYTTDYKTTYKDADIIFIGVGTSENSDGLVDLSCVKKVSKQIAQNIEKDCLIIIKSTVPVGTNEKIEKYIKELLVNNVKVELASNPEFLSQGTAVRDLLHAKRIVIGVENKEIEERLINLYKPFNLPIVSVNRRSAEMIKYASNNFLALKISYINDIANLCELVGANIEDVVKGMSYDDRIGSSFLQAGVGYGGSCFTKDTKALKYLANKYGYNLETVEAAINVNINQKVILYKKAKKRLITFNNLKVAILGLTFKPETDDVREAPSLDNIKLLLKENAKIYVFDPRGEEKFKKSNLDKINYMSSAEDALKEADVCFIFTQWDEIRYIKPDKYKELMKTPLVYDGRNIYNLKDMKNAGVEYYSIGR